MTTFLPYPGVGQVRRALGNGSAGGVHSDGDEVEKSPFNTSSAFKMHFSKKGVGGSAGGVAVLACCSMVDNSASATNE